jgi:hypothetical protein
MQFDLAGFSQGGVRRFNIAHGRSCFDRNGNGWFNGLI